MIKIITRLYRKLIGHCIVCNRKLFTIKYWYCSFQCMSDDGYFAVRADHPNNKKKPNLFKSNTDEK